MSKRTGGEKSSTVNDEKLEGQKLGEFDKLCYIFAKFAIAKSV